MHAFLYRDIVAAHSSTSRVCLILSGCVRSLRWCRRVCTEEDAPTLGGDGLGNRRPGSSEPRRRGQDNGTASLAVVRPESAKATGQTDDGGIAKPGSSQSHQLPPRTRWRADSLSNPPASRPSTLPLCTLDQGFSARPQIALHRPE